MPEAEFAPGSVVPGTSYRIFREIGRGGMGAVYECVDESVDAVRVIKTLLPKLVANTKALQFFRTEARTLANLDHENIVRVFTAGVTPGGIPYFVMERLNGSSLADVMTSRGSPLPHRTAIDIGIQMLRGLEYAHERGIVHRDIKPENVFLHADGPHTRIKLLDFGVLKLVEDDAVTEIGPQAKRVFIGTRRWASPEQLACESVNAKSDLYSTALMLYSVLSGHVPYADDPIGRATGETPPLVELVPHLHPLLDAAIMAALHRDPGRRPRDAYALASELLRVDRILERSHATATLDVLIADLHDVPPLDALRVAPIAAPPATVRDPAPAQQAAQALHPLAYADTVRAPGTPAAPVPAARPGPALTPHAPAPPEVRRLPAADLQTVAETPFAVADNVSHVPAPAASLPYGKLILAGLVACVGSVALVVLLFIVVRATATHDAPPQAAPVQAQAPAALASPTPPPPAAPPPAAPPPAAPAPEPAPKPARPRKTETAEVRKAAPAPSAAPTPSGPHEITNYDLLGDAWDPINSKKDAGAKPSDTAGNKR